MSKYRITVRDDDPNSPLLKSDDRTPVLIRRRTDVDWERVSGWISVKDRLPEDSDIGKRFLLYGEFSYPEQIAAWTQWGWQNVTHWQPLPEPPTTE